MEDYAAKFVHGNGIADEITHFLDAPTQGIEQANNDNENIEVPKNVMWYNRSVVDNNLI